MTDKRGLPPWVWIGCGCAGAIAALVLVVVGLGFWGAQKARELSETISDPDARNAKAVEVLGADELPDGYHTVAAFSMPFVFDFAVLSDQPPDARGRPTELATHGFIFTSFPAFGQGDRELYDFFEGRSESIESLRRENFNLNLDERLARGQLTRADDDVLWVSHRGALDADDIENPHQGLVTMVLFECDDDRRRVGIWFGPDPSPEAGAAELELAGTVADDSEIARFLEPLAPCR